MTRWILCLLLSLLLCLIGCGCTQNSVPKPNKKAEGDEMLRRIADLNAWGFSDAAENFYQQMTLTGRSATIRYAAFEQWLLLLAAKGKENALVAAQEEMLKAFPAEASHLRRKLIEHYVAVWEWSKAKAKMQELLTTADTERSEIIEQISWIEAWEKRPLVWQENFLYTNLGWQLAHPDHYKVDTQQRQFQAMTLTGSWYHAGKDFYWDGSSSSVQWDMRITRIEWVGTVLFGIFSPLTKNGIGARLSCGGGTGDFHYGISLVVRNDSEDNLRRNTLPEYSPEVWYTLELAYLKPLRQVCLRLWKREQHLLLGEQIYELSTPFPAGNYLIGFAPVSKGSPNDVTALTESLVDNIELKGAGWKECLIDWPLAGIYHVNAKAQQHPDQALKECTLILQENKESWQLLETRAWLLYSFKQLTKAGNDIQKVLLLYPNHPNKDYFQRLISEHEKRENR